MSSRLPLGGATKRRTLSRRKTVDELVRHERVRRLDPATRLLALTMSPSMRNKPLIVPVPGRPRGSGRSEAKTVTLDEDVSVYLRLVAMNLARVYNSTTNVVSTSEQDDYLLAGPLAHAFLARGLPVDTILTHMKTLKPALEKTLQEIYTLKPDEAAVTPKSVMAPTLRWAMTHSPKLQNIIDWNKRLVVKYYPLTNMLRAAADEELTLDVRYEKLIELVNDVVLGAAFANAMVMSRTQATTPHFVFQLDWFLGPFLDKVKPTAGPGKTRDYEDVALESDETDDSDSDSDSEDTVPVEGARPSGRYGLATPRRRLDNLNVTLPAFDTVFDDSRLAQYVVVERVDRPLVSLTSAGAALPVMKALLFQVLFSLEAGYETYGFLHYDPHFSNIMVRELEKEPQSPYLNAPWLYARAPDRINPAAAARHYQLTPAQHGNKFAEIIDFGRSRAFCKTTLENKPARVLIGNPTLKSIGIYPEPTNADRSWDVRTIGFNLIFTYKPVATGVASKLMPWDTLAPYKHFVSMAANLPHLCVVLHEMFGDAGDPSSDKVIGALVKKHFPPKRPYNPNALLTEAAYVEFYNGVVPIILKYYSYNEICGIVLWVDADDRFGTRNSSLHASALLNLPFFDEFKIDPATAPHRDAIRVGVVEFEDTLLHPLHGIERTAPRTPVATRRRRRSMDEDDAPAEDPRQARKQRRFDSQACMNCGHDATGLAIAAATGEHTAHAYCSHACMHMAADAGILV